MRREYDEKRRVVRRGQEEVRELKDQLEEETCLLEERWNKKLRDKFLDFILVVHQ